jgi:hypothetical protein
MLNSFFSSKGISELSEFCGGLGGVSLNGGVSLGGLGGVSHVSPDQFSAHTQNQCVPL